MSKVKRWGVMTLVALLVLGTMGAAPADEGTAETAATKEPLEQGSYEFAPDWANDLVTFVFYWGFDEGDEPECEDSEVAPSVGTLFGPVPVGVDPAECVQLNVEKNGHVNHGSMVSSFVHWLKGGNLEDLVANTDLGSFQDMPKGQLVKQFAHEDFGKGFFDLEGISDVETADVEAEESDGHGQPTWVKDKKADKPAKGKNK
jgi:hypothetical protein